jgi:hypothetical protein
MDRLHHGLDLRLVDGADLPDELRRAHRPGERVRGEDGRERELPRVFYEVPSWEAAIATPLTPHVSLYELLSIDVREDAAARAWPRYVPCAVVLLAAALEVVRQAVGERVLIAANGGYRSPAHGIDPRDGTFSPHHWGTAADLYRIGDTWLEDEASIARYRDVVLDVLPGAFVRPYGPGDGETDDHLHLDLGYAVSTPPGA